MCPECFHYLLNPLSVVSSFSAEEPRRLLAIVEATILYAYLMLLIDRITILLFFKHLVKLI